MSFAAGTRFGVYEITGLIGVGGMGEVYRASDTKLGREVAIKTLPSELASDRDRLARFEREAKLLATLNHPHIAAVYGLDDNDGTKFLAMELVEGETLERKLKSAPLPVEDALRLALQIAEALEAAHENGVVHRDLKPANVMITRDGRVKVLDFGLAKAFSGHPNATMVANSPALSLAMTQQGFVLGTAGYMSPEQASGQATDQRADIWAFGVVLYEMLTGKPLFSGESVPHILADVLRSEPDWNRLPKNLHPRLQLLLERCLTKKPRNRLHSIADARVEIDAVLSGPQGATPVSATAAGTNSANARRLAGAVVVTAVLAGMAGWFLRPASAPEPKPVARFSVQLPDEQSFSNQVASLIAVSPDGTRIAYAANNQIFLRNVDEREARPVPGTNETGAGTPVFSPDGQWLAYTSIGGPAGPFSVKRVPISGGAPVPVHEARSARDFPDGLSWPKPDTIVFANSEGVVRIPANGGATEVIVARGEDERFDSPQILPDGKTVLFTRRLGSPGTLRVGGLETAQVVVQSIGRDDRTVVWEGGSAARYLPSGHLVYAQGTALFAIPFDPARRTVRGGPVPMAEGLRRSRNGATDTANFAVSDTGTLVMIPADPNAGAQARIETTLTWVDRGGREEPFPVRPDDYTYVRISPDGTKVALVIGAARNRPTRPAIWIFDQRTGTLSLLTADPEGDDGPVWSSDGSRIFFRSQRGETDGVYAIDVQTGETTVLAASADFPFPRPSTVSPDDQTLGLSFAFNLVNRNLATLSLAGGEFVSLLATEAQESDPAISPSGTWLAYSGAVGDATSEINIRPFPAVSRTRIPVSAGDSPVFSRDGSELFFFDGRGLSAVPVTYEPTLRVGTPQRLFDSRDYMWSLVGRIWDADPSGQRFLMIRQPAEAATQAQSGQIDVVLNWFEELERRVPAD